MDKRIMLSAALMTLLLSANAQKRAFAIEDLYKVRGVTSMSLSPDGKTLCYTSGSSDLKAQKSTSDIFVMTGELDYRVPYTQSLQYFTALQTLNIPSRLIVLKYDGHWPSNLKSMPLYYNAHLDWFHRYLGGAPAPWDTEKMVNNEVEY